MIDLNKNQLVDGDVKVRVWDDKIEYAEILCIYYIDHRSKYPFVCWHTKQTGSQALYHPSRLVSYKHAELIQPKYKVKEFYDLVDVLKKQGYFPKWNVPEYLSSDNYKLFFHTDMFAFCGKNPDENKYNWYEDWLEEVEDDQNE